MASLRARLEAVATGQADTLPVMGYDESRAAATKVLALLAAADACQDKLVIQAVKTRKALLAAIAAFEEK